MSRVDANGAIHAGDSGRFTGHSHAEADANLLGTADHAEVVFAAAPALISAAKLAKSTHGTPSKLRDLLLLDDGYAYTADADIAIRVRTPLADGANQVGVSLSAAGAAAKAAPEAESRLLAGGDGVEVGGLPIVVRGNPMGVAAHINLFATYSPAVDSYETPVASLARQARSSTGQVELDGWDYPAERISKAMAALRGLGVKQCSVDWKSITNHTGTVRKAALRLSAPGVQIMLLSNAAPEGAGV